MTARREERTTPYGEEIPVTEVGAVRIRQRENAAWIHNQAIQKAIESYFVPEKRKTYLRSLRQKE